MRTIKYICAKVRIYYGEFGKEHTDFTYDDLVMMTRGQVKLGEIEKDAIMRLWANDTLAKIEKD